jgi:uncharacterized protein (TIGR02391 family)
MATIQAFDETKLQAICDVLADTSTGLTGSEISRLLRDCNIADPEPTITKRHRLFVALEQKQTSDGVGNCVVKFILTAMSPVRYIGSRDRFESKRGELNAALAFSGLLLEEHGRMRRVTAARTIGEAEARANGLRRTLIERRVHPDVLRFCRAELIQDNYFHAVFEATKSVAAKIRELSGLTSDGSKLVDEAFGGGSSGYPRLVFNSLRSESERSEHSGLMNLMKGVFGAFRNTLPTRQRSIGL